MKLPSRWLPVLVWSALACSEQLPTSSEGTDVGTDPVATPTDSSPDMPEPTAAPSVKPPTPGGPGEDFIDNDGSDLDCVPKTCAEQGFDCGKAGDTCGASLECGECDPGHLCGGETPNVCLAPRPCTAATSCAELGWECGTAVDECNNRFDCAAEGLTCGELETCIAGADGKTKCQAGSAGGGECDVCGGVADCEGQAQATRITGRVITPGRADDDVGNQVGVPNAFVYILTNNDPSLLPAFVDGIPDGATACDRCEGQDLGPVLAGATTDALGYYTLDGNVPVGVEFLLVVKVGRFRRAIPVTLPETSACATTELDMLETRLPRSMDDGIGANIPLVAISTGQIDAMECVFEKMGVAHQEFNVPGDGTNPERIHLYGENGAEMPGGNPDEETLYDDLARVTSYDMLVFDCKATEYLNPPPAGALDNIREYVNRGGRMFASHLSYQWICRNGDEPFSPDDPVATGLSPSAGFAACEGNAPLPIDVTDTGFVSVGRPQANATKVADLASWLVNEGAATENADGSYEFQIIEPRDLVEELGDASEEFVYRELSGGEPAVQQYAFTTPYGAPEEASCGRVAYSAFHVSASTPDEEPEPTEGDAGAPGPGPGGPGGGNGGVATSVDPFLDVTFPEHCAGDLTAQEKVLLFMLFDLGACVGDPPEPPECAPLMCEDVDAECGLISDGCGEAVDCGPCPEGEVCGLIEPNKCAACVPKTCDEVDIECGVTGDGCGGSLVCECPAGLQCGFPSANRCGDPDVAN